MTFLCEQTQGSPWAFAVRPLHCLRQWVGSGIPEPLSSRGSGSPPLPRSCQGPQGCPPVPAAPPGHPASPGHTSSQLVEALHFLIGEPGVQFDLGGAFFKKQNKTVIHIIFSSWICCELSQRKGILKIFSGPITFTAIRCDCTFFVWEAVPQGVKYFNLR